MARGVHLRQPIMVICDSRSWLFATVDHGYTKAAEAAEMAEVVVDVGQRPEGDGHTAALCSPLELHVMINIDRVRKGAHDEPCQYSHNEP